MVEIENNKKNLLVCECEPFLDGALFRYAHIYRNAYSFLNPSLFIEVSFLDLGFFLVLTTLILCYLNATGFRTSKFDHPAGPPIAYVLEKPTLTGNHVQNRSNQTPPFATITTGGLAPPQVTQPHARKSKFVAGPAAQQLFRPVPRDVSACVFEYSSQHKRAQQFFAANEELISAAGGNQSNPSKQPIKIPNLLPEAQSKYSQEYGEIASIEDQQFVTYFKQYLLEYVDKRSGQIRSYTSDGITYSVEQVKQQIAHTIALYQFMPITPIDRIEEILPEIRANLTRYTKGEITLEQCNQNRDRFRAILVSIDANDIPVLNFFEESEREKAAFIYVFKRAAYDCYGNCYPEWSCYYELHYAHLCANKGGASKITINMASMSDANHALCTEVEKIVSPQTAPREGGRTLLKGIFEKRRGDISKRNTEFDSGIANRKIHKHLRPIRSRVEKINWTEPTAFFEAREELNKCINLPYTNKYFVVQNCKLIQDLCMSIANNWHSSLGDKLVITAPIRKENAATMVGFSKMTALDAGRQLRDAFLEQYRLKLKLTELPAFPRL